MIALLRRLFGKKPQPPKSTLIETTSLIPPKEYEIGDYVLLPSLITWCVDGDIGVMMYSTAKVLGPPVYQQDRKRWTQVVTFDEKYVPDLETHETRKGIPEWITNPPSVDFFTDSLVKIAPEGVEFADFFTQAENNCITITHDEPTYFKDEEDVDQTRYLLEEVDEARLKIMRDCWQKHFEQVLDP